MGAVFWPLSKVVSVCVLLNRRNGEKLTAWLQTAAALRVDAKWKLMIWHWICTGVAVVLRQCDIPPRERLLCLSSSMSMRQVCFTASIFCYSGGAAPLTSLLAGQCVAHLLAIRKLSTSHGGEEEKEAVNQVDYQICVTLKCSAVAASVSSKKVYICWCVDSRRPFGTCTWAIFNLLKFNAMQRERDVVVEEEVVLLGAMSECQKNARYSHLFIHTLSSL